MLVLEPCGAEGELQSPVRRVIDRDGLGGEDRRMSVRDACDEQPEPDRRGLTGERGQGRHAVEGFTGALAVHGLEMIETPGSVEAESLGELHPADDLVPRHALLRNIDPESHGGQRTVDLVLVRIRSSVGAGLAGHGACFDQIWNRTGAPMAPPA